MALVVKDRVKQTTTTTGTGSVVLNGTVSGFQTFAAALSNGDTTYYAIFEPSTNEYEVGLGTWTESSATLARTTILESSNSGSAVSLTAQAEVFITQPAEKAVYLDASNNVTLTNNLTVSGDFTVSGTTTTIDTTNSVVTDSLIELSNGTTGTPANDAGIVIERGDSDNAFIGYDESADKFTVGTGSFTGASTGNLTISTGTLVANVEGNLTGNVTGNVSGSSGSTTGNAATATALQTARTIAGQSFDGTADITIAPTDLTGVTSTAAELNILDGVTSTTAELNLLDGVTATTTELNYVDGVTSAIQTQLDAKAPINNPTFTGSISHAGDLTIDVGGDITLDAGGQNIRLKDDGTEFGQLLQDSNNFVLYSSVSDADMIFKGNDGGVITTALTLDMSNSGNAVFNNHIYLSDNGKAFFGSGSDLQIYHDGSHSYISDQGTGNLRILAGEFNVKSASGNTDLIYAVNGGSVYLYYNGNTRITTNATGTDFVGTITADGLTVDKTDTATYSSTAVDDTLVITRKNSSGTNNQVVGIEFDVTQASGVTTGVAGISAVQPTNASSADLVFQTRNAGTIGERMRIDSSGNVGIGTTSPQATIHVHDSATSSNNLQLSNAATGATTSDGIVIGMSSANAYFYNRENTDLRFGTNNTERMRIDSSGNVGVGTSAPSQQLHVYRNTTDGSAASLKLENAGATASYATLDATAGTVQTFLYSDAAGNALGVAGATLRTVSNHPLIFGTNNTERMRITSDGNVGIGTSSPSRDLYISGGGSSRADVQLSYDALGTSAADGVQLGIQAAGGYIWNFENSSLYFATNNSERMRIDSSGNFLVGKTSTNTINTVGHDLTDHGEVMHTTDGGTTMYLNRKTSDGTIVDFRKDGTNVGSIATESGDLVIGTGDTGVKFNDNLNSIYPYHTDISNGSQDNSIDIGYSTARFRNAYLSGSLSDGTTSRTVADIVGTTSSQFLRSDADDTTSGSLGVGGILHTSGSSSGGVRIGANSSGYPLLTTVNGVELVIRDTDQIRFSDSTSWDYSAWAGIRYEAGSNLMTIGGPSSSKFTSNAGPSDITINFDGLSGSDGLTYEGNPIWHDGNTATVIDQTTDITSQDWNTYIDGTEASWARVLNMSGSNKPPNYTYGTALSISMSASNKFQLYASHTGSDGNGLYFRTGWNTDYRGWAKIYDSVAHPALSYVDTATGSYGTIKVDDDRGVTWAGYAIRDDWVFMSNGAGNCGIYNDTDNEWAMYITQNGSVQLRYNGATTLETTSGGAAVTGALTATGDITAYYSDERLKNFEGKIDGALDKVSKLSGYYFRENDKAKELGYENDARQVGVSAQEVEAVMPEVVKPAPVDPEYKTVQYEKLVPLLIEAIKELKEEVRQLKEDKA